MRLHVFVFIHDINSLLLRNESLWWKQMFAVKFKSVSHSYSEKPVLHNINLTLDENRITIILGKSGSGKSTLLQMINGLINPESGSIRIFNNPLD